MIVHHTELVSSAFNGLPGHVQRMLHSPLTIRSVGNGHLHGMGEANPVKRRPMETQITWSRTGQTGHMIRRSLWSSSS